MSEYYASRSETVARTGHSTHMSETSWCWMGGDTVADPYARVGSRIDERGTLPAQRLRGGGTMGVGSKETSQRNRVAVQNPGKMRTASCVRDSMNMRLA